MRVYVPVTLSDLPAALSGRWEPQSGYAVTGRLLDIAVDDDEELLAEQVRDIAAVDAVLELRSPRRAVVVVDYPRADVTPVPNGHPAAVALEGRVDPSTIACAFVDEQDAAKDGAAAATGDGEALDRLEMRDLLWFDATEIDAID
ncbi:DUF6912 family protein [Demequina activiva]|uniref:Uncharacterized protein n=1 Tax=Demequina activiva TaxID=1582364 RepID=A0A919Q746_9MICO|nr:hypothetical protein [Demequina activiva]GIG55413.1 hypothetical protein Dac01nite_21650 [Demequina activiva]